MVRKPARNSQTTLLCAMPLRRNDPTIHARLMGSIGRNWMKIFRTKASSHINTPFFPFLLRICPLFGAVSPNNTISPNNLLRPFAPHLMRVLFLGSFAGYYPAFFGCLPPVVSLLLAVYLRFLSFSRKKSSKICIYQKIVVILHPKIYAGGICLFVRVDFLTY